MGEEQQQDIIAFLSRPETHGGNAVERIDTHISHLFLAGDRAYKLKRALKLGFLDYSTVALRKLNCEREVAVNRRAAPGLYLGVTAVTKSRSGLTLGGDGEPVDWLVVMKRFDQDTLFDRLAMRGGLDGALIDRLADRLVRLHGDAERKPRHGGPVAMRAAFAYARDELGRLADSPCDGAGLARLEDAIEGLIGRHHGLLGRRGGQGFVRQCHGDMHLANICLVEGRPTPFDAIEFDDRLVAIDTLYDLAFVLMDLIHFGRADFANRLLNRYLEGTRDYRGLAPMPLYLSLRAAIRAMAAALVGGARKQSEGRRYFELAGALARGPERRLIAIGGLSGSGKTTVARCLAIEMAPGAGAVHLRSDAIRKRLFGLSPETPLPEAAYSAEVSGRVFARMHKDASAALRADQTVILDATHMAPRLRAAVAALARREEASFSGLWLDAPLELLAARAELREGDASDAGARVVRDQAAADLGDVTWARIDATANPDKIVASALASLRP